MDRSDRVVMATPALILRKTVFLISNIQMYPCKFWKVYVLLYTLNFIIKERILNNLPILIYPGRLRSQVKLFRSHS